MKLSEYVNDSFRQAIGAAAKTLILGQNVSAGSRLGGLTKFSEEDSNVSLVNTPNSESTLAGFSLGAAMGGQDVIFWLKQQDFLYLGLDALINTVSLLRNQNIDKNASCTFVTTTMDSGWEGPQASGNFGHHLSVLTGIRAYFGSGPSEISAAVSASRRPGISLVLLSQKCLASETDDFPSGEVCELDGTVTYIPDNASSSRDLTVVTSNFALLETLNFLKEQPRVRPRAIVNIFNPTAFIRKGKQLGSGEIVFVSDSFILEHDLVRSLELNNPHSKMHVVGRQGLFHDRRPQDLLFKASLLAGLESFLGGK